MDIREFVDGIGLVSVGSRLSEEDVILIVSGLGLRGILACNCVWLRLKPCPGPRYGWGLGEADLLAARVAAMKDADFGSGAANFPAQTVESRRANTASSSSRLGLDPTPPSKLPPVP